NMCMSCRLAERVHRSGHKGTVPKKGRPGRDLKRSRPNKGEGEPRKGSPLFLCLLPKLSPAALRRRARRGPMFARTPRLLLRPGFPEDAPALAGIMSDKIARNLAVVPWPYSLRDAEAFLAS